MLRSRSTNQALFISTAALLFLASAHASDLSTPVATGGPFDTVLNLRNLPSASDASAFPRAWLTIYGNPERDAAYSIPDNSPAWVKDGVAWKFAEARAWPLSKPAYDADAIGLKSAETTAAQWLGNAVGVSVADGMVFSASSDQFVYALNARTGQLIWRASPVGTTFMGQPLVDGNLVFVNAGTVGFNYSNVQGFARTGKAIRGAGVAYNGIYALDRASGKLVWKYGTAGDAMPTPVIASDSIIFSTGAGDVVSLNKLTGADIWKRTIGGMGNMSSPALDHGRIFVGMSSPAFLFALDEATGKPLWKATIPNSSNTGMGDVSPAVSQGIVITDAVSDAQTKAGTTTMDVTVGAFDGNTGKPLWTHKMGRGQKPPSFKGGVPMIHDGIVYVGTPVRSEYQALDLKTGALLWTWKIPDPSEAGSGRGPAAFYDGKLYIATGAALYVLNPKTGELLGEKVLGGRFAIAGPTVIGGTIYVASSWDWVMAVRTSNVLGAGLPPHHESKSSAP